MMALVVVLEECAKGVIGLCSALPVVEIPVVVAINAMRAVDLSSAIN